MSTLFTRLTFIIVLTVIQAASFNLVPSGSLFLTQLQFEGFSLFSYGMFFLPIILSGIFFSWWGGSFAQRKGLYPLFVLGMFSNILSMFLFGGALISSLFPALSYGFFLLALLFLGGGFAATAITLASLVRALFPKKAISSLCLIFAASSAGTALGPILLQVSVGRGLLWALVLCLAIAFIFLLIIFDFLDPFHIKKEKRPYAPTLKGGWVFFFSLFCVGLIETMTTSWLPLYFSKATDSIFPHPIFTTIYFWAMTSLGRVVVGLMGERAFKWLYPLLPLFVCIFALSPSLTSNSHVFLLFFGLIGFLQGPLLPFTIAFGQKHYLEFEFTFLGRALTGFWIGYGLGSSLFAAFQKWHLFTLASFFPFIALSSLFLFFLNYITCRKYRLR